MNEKQEWTTTGGPFKLIKKPIGFFSSYESRQEITRKSKPSKFAELTFIKKIRSMRKKIKYLTEAEESQDEQVRNKKYCSSADSQTPSSHQLLKRRAPFSNNEDQVFRKLLKAEEENNENQGDEVNENEEHEVGQNIYYSGDFSQSAATRYFQQTKGHDEDELKEDKT